MATTATEVIQAAQANPAVGITTIEQANVQAGNIDLPSIPAHVALGLDEPTKESVAREVEKAKKVVPEDKGDLQRDENGRFKRSGEDAAVPAKPAKAAAPKKDPAANTTTEAGVTTTEKPVNPAPAANPAAPAATTAPVEATPKTVKIAGKEYPIEELEKALQERESRSAAPTQEQRQVATAPQAAPRDPTPEEVTAMESNYVSQIAKDLPDLALPPETLEQILVGGAEGAKALVEFQKTAIARAILEARKSIYKELNPVMKSLDERLMPVLQNHQELERHAVAHAFSTTFPEYQGKNLEMARKVAETLVQQYPDIVGRYSREQFIKEVDRQTDMILQDEWTRWNPAATGTWKEHVRSQMQKPAAAVTPTGATASVTPQAPPPAAAPAAPTRPAVKPPAGNSPGSVTGSGKDWQKSTASSLID
jgi:hypothetical protein